MTGLFEGLARRGAGLAPETGAALIGLRPRARFEPLAGLPEAEGGAAVAPADTPPPSASERTAPPARDAIMPLTPLRSAPGAGEAPPAPPEPSPASSPAAPIAPPAPGSSSEPPAAVAAEIIRETVAAPIEPVFASNAPPPAVAEPTMPREPPGPETAQETRAEPSAIEAPVRRAPPPDAAPIAPTAGDLRPDAIAEPQPEPPAPQVTIAIERIDIAFAPPTPARAAAPPAISRSSGFAAYARARRGSPR